MKEFCILLFTLLLFVITQPSVARIYKWVDQDGNIKFSDKKPADDNQSEEVKLKINTVKVPKHYNNSFNADYDSTSKYRNNEPFRSNKVIIYSASWCGVCKTAKRYFNERGIPYKEYDVENSAKGRNDFKRLRGKGVPVILVGKKRMDGFDRSWFDRLFNQK